MSNQEFGGDPRPRWAERHSKTDRTLVNALVVVAVALASAWAIPRLVLAYEARQALRLAESAMQTMVQTSVHSLDATVSRMQERAKYEQAKADQIRLEKERHQAEFALIEARRKESERLAAERDLLDGRYYPEADDSMPVGVWACRNAQMVRRAADGWTVPLDGQGRSAKCRLDP